MYTTFAQSLLESLEDPLLLGPATPTSSVCAQNLLDLGIYDHNEDISGPPNLDQPPQPAAGWDYPADEEEIPGPPSLDLPQQSSVRAGPGLVPGAAHANEIE